MIDQLGLGSAAAVDVTNPIVLSLAITGVVILIIVILFLSYFTVLRAIAAYSYSNSRFKAVGTPYLSKTQLETLCESSSLLDMSSRLAEHELRVPQGTRVSIEELEDALEAETIRMLRNTLAATPDGSKPFFRAYLSRMDALQVKKALRGVRSGEKPSLHPVYYVDAETIRLLKEVTSPQEVGEILGDNMLGTTLSEAIQQHPDKPVMWEMELDKMIFKNLYSSVGLLDDEIREPIKEFHGRMVDVYNINTMARARTFKLPPQDTLALLAPGGRELTKWTLEQLVDVQEFTNFISELDQTTYGRHIKNKALRVRSPAELEYALDNYMLTMVGEVAAKNTLLAGPALRFAYGKEREAKNIMGVARAVVDRVPFTDVEPFLIAEGN